MNTSAPAIGNVYIATTEGKLRTFENNLKKAGYQIDEQGNLSLNATELMVSLAEKAASAIAPGPCQECRDKDEKVLSFELEMNKLQDQHKAEIALISGQQKTAGASFEAKINALQQQLKAAQDAEAQLKRTSNELQMKLAEAQQAQMKLKSTELEAYRAYFSEVKGKELTTSEAFHILLKLWSEGSPIPRIRQKPAK